MVDQALALGIPLGAIQAMNGPQDLAKAIVEYAKPDNLRAGGTRGHLDANSGKYVIDYRAPTLAGGQTVDAQGNAIDVPGAQQGLFRQGLREPVIKAMTTSAQGVNAAGEKVIQPGHTESDLLFPNGVPDVGQYTGATAAAIRSGQAPPAGVSMKEWKATLADAAKNPGAELSYTAPGTSSAVQLPIPTSPIQPKEFRTGVGPTQQAEASEAGKNFANQALAVDSDARAAQSVLARNQEITGLSNMFTPGAATPARENVAKWASALGMPDSVVNDIAGGNLSAIQAMGKQVVQGAFDSAKTALSGGGRITQAEIILQAKNSPNVAMTKPAIDAMIQFQNGVAQWQVDKQQGKDAWISNRGSYAGFEADWNKTHPLSSYVPSAEALRAALFPGKGSTTPTVSGFSRQQLLEEARRRGMQVQ